MGWNQRLRVSFPGHIHDDSILQIYLFIFRSGGNISSKMEILKGAQKCLFDSGARNFLFINLPPIERSPGMLDGEHSSKQNEHAIMLSTHWIPLVPLTSNASQIYKDWNKYLAETVHQFANDNLEEITAMTYSSYDTFTHVLDDPISYRFMSEDVRKEAGGIWYDDLHPTSRMHNVIAADIVQFLEGKPEYGFVEERS